MATVTSNGAQAEHNFKRCAHQTCMIAETKSLPEINFIRQITTSFRIDPHET